MPDTVLSNGVHLIAGGDSAWKPSTDINLTLFNTLIGRVTTLEGLHGGAIANYWPVPSGSTWTETVAIITAAQNTGLGQIVILPNETIIQDASWEITKSIEIRGSGPLSKIKTNGDLSIFGSSIQTIIYNPSAPMNGPVIFRNFGIEHTRNSTNRMLCIAISDYVRGVELDRVTFTNMTSDCITVLPNEGTTLRAKDIHVHDCIANEWYEAFFNHHQGSADNINVHDNTGTCTAAHPNGSVSQPYGLEVNIEQGSGNVDRAAFVNNTFSITCSSGAGNPSIGMIMNFSGGATQWRFNGVLFKKNTITGPYYGAYIGTSQSGGSGTSSYVVGETFTTFVENKIQSCQGEVVRMHPVDANGSQAIRYVVADNELIKSGGQVGLDIDMTSAPISVINFGSATPLTDNNIHT